VTYRDGAAALAVRLEGERRETAELEAEAAALRASAEALEADAVVLDEAVKTARHERKPTLQTAVGGLASIGVVGLGVLDGMIPQHNLSVAVSVLMFVGVAAVGFVGIRRERAAKKVLADFDREMASIDARSSDTRP
jgi:hypothetical protein